MSKFERRIVLDGNDECCTGSTRDDTGGNREMKHITVDGLREITDRLVTFTAETFDDGCPVHAFVVDACGKTVFVMPDESMQDKGCFAEAIAQIAEETDAVAVVVVDKSWVTGDDWDGVTPPSQCPGRREMLLAAVETADGTSMHLWPILRNGNSVSLGECVVECGDGFTGRFAGLLRRPRPDLN